MRTRKITLFRRVSSNRYAYIYKAKTILVLRNSSRNRKLKEFFVQENPFLCIKIEVNHCNDITSFRSFVFSGFNVPFDTKCISETRQYDTYTKV